VLGTCSILERFSNIMFLQICIARLISADRECAQEAQINA